ncbi:hypothetical protein BDZ89DRAFT_1110222 [Hymenopellis radicata]|nr:hypothetical protein BDZ89DRAFT_1110222 [Hymenopellis radicata]
MSPPWEDYGFTVADVQSLMSTELHPTILLAFCHGIHTSILFITLYYIIESTQSTRKRMTLTGIITFLWFANTVILALDWKYVDHLFIAHGTSLETEFNFAFGTGDTAFTIATDVLRCLSVFIADLILVWRCWVLYGGNLKVIAIPSLCVITETLSACMAIVFFLEDVNFANASRVNWSLVYYSMTVATNSVCTILILFRIVRISGLGASLKTYRGIIEILVESAAIFMTLAQQSRLPPLPCDDIVQHDRHCTHPHHRRVMAGQSRPNDSWTRPSLPHMGSDVLSSTESLQFAGGPNHSTQTTSASTGHATADIDLEGQAQEIVEEPREQDGDEGRAEAGPCWRPALLEGLRWSRWLVEEERVVVVYLPSKQHGNIIPDPREAEKRDGDIVATNMSYNLINIKEDREGLKGQT